MLKRGYTTGTCSAIAAKAAARMIFEKSLVYKEKITVPEGTVVECDILDPQLKGNTASCAVKKYAGDDPDITDGMLIYAELTLNKGGINIEGGKGIGRVTKKGLEQEIGQAAINKVPRRMIYNAVEEIFDLYGYDKGADIIISAPEGEEKAKKTFNPRLGIEGGISILGTSGIVEPMSEKALTDTIKVEINVKKANEAANVLLLSPGNYGVDFLRESYGIDLNRAVKYSNFLGEALDFAIEAGYKKILIAGHIGKLVKVAGGIMNTHSRNADCRMEIIASNTALVTEDIALVKRLMTCLTTDEAVELLREKGLCDSLMNILVEKMAFYIKNRINDKAEAGILTFSNVYGLLGKTENADEIIKQVIL